VVGEAMIDTLRLARRLQAAQMPKDQAEALAEGLDESLRDSYVTREYLDLRLSQLTSDLTWRMVGTMFAVVGVLNTALFVALSLLRK